MRIQADSEVKITEEPVKGKFHLIYSLATAWGPVDPTEGVFVSIMEHYGTKEELREALLKEFDNLVTYTERDQDEYLK